MSQVVPLDAEQINTLTQAGIIPHGTPPAQIAVFARICKERGLSPFSKEIYLVGYGGKFSTIVGINGLRKIAADTHQHAGTDDVKFDLQPDGTYKTAAQLADARALPQTATATVYRIVSGQRVAFTHTAVYKEFAGTGKWQQMPFQMIAKVAEAFALRKAFADRVTGLDIEEEGGAYQEAPAVHVQPLDVMEKGKSKIRYMIEQAHMDDMTLRSVEAALENATTINQLTAIAETVKQYIPESSDPRRVNDARAKSQSYK
jgi:phage recombination protein Bet